MSCPPEDKFKEQVIELLSMTEYATRTAAKGFVDARLAARLGVTSEVLDRAAMRSRAAFAPVHGMRKTAIDLFLGSALADPIDGAAALYGVGAGVLMRSVLHQAMLSPREPNRRTTAYKPMPGCEAYRAKLTEGRPPRYTKGMEKHVRIDLSKGLHVALEKRASAFGSRCGVYIRLWMADLLDGLLADMPFSFVDRGQVFEDERAYLLPVIESADRATLGADGTG